VKKFSKSVSKDVVANNMMSLFKAMMFIAMLSVPNLLFAAAGDVNFGATCGTAKSFFNGISGMLKVISVIVITVAIIFCGYQIAFAHKRISDVAPILLGALLIGAAGTIAAMMMSADTNTSTAAC
jgi:type IV secretion system protein VirB2